MRDYPCLNNEYVNISELLNNMPASKEMLYEAKNIVELALLTKNMKKEGKDIFCKLPFDHILEAESLGAKPHFDKERMELRLSVPPFLSFTDIINTPAIDFEKGRINQVLDAAEILIKKGESVILNISGPFTVLSSLLSSERIFRGWRKEPECLNKVIQKLSGEIVRFLIEGQRRGIKYFSYADPFGSLNILGPKLIPAMVENYLYPLIREMEALLHTDEVLILCPKSSLALIDMKKATVREVPLTQKMSYQEGILQVRNTCKVVGMHCINRDVASCISDRMQEIVLL